MIIEVITPSEWLEMGSNAHKAAFGHDREGDRDRFTFALLGVENDLPIGYILVRENEKDSAYLPYGGIFPACKDKGQASELFQAGLEFIRKEYKYKNVSCNVENKNYRMLKIALNNQFLPIGLRCVKDRIFLEMRREWED